MHIHLSAVTQEDLESLVAIRIAAMRESLTRIDRFDPQRARERFVSGFCAAHTYHILCCDDHVGFVVVTPAAGFLALDQLYVLPAWQGQGIGAWVLNEVFTHADPNNLPVRVGALRESAPNRFYIIVGLWSGEPFRYDGTFFQVEEVRFVPRPLQTPRIPIWVGGGWPLKGPAARAARWDGSRLYKHQGESLTPDDVRALGAFVQQQRGSLAGYDIVVSGSQRHADAANERDRIDSLAQAGATWCTAYLPPDAGDLTQVRTIIAHGPLRSD